MGSENSSRNRNQDDEYLCADWEFKAVQWYVLQMFFRLWQEEDMSIYTAAWTVFPN